MSFLSLLIFAFTIVSMWFVLVKAGEEGWKALIPVYNFYILFKISGKTKLWPGYLASMLISIPLLLIGYILLFAGMFRNDGLLTLSTIFMILSFIASIVGIVVSVKMTIALGHKFGKRGGFIVGMVLLSPVFYGILAFDKNIVYDADAE